MNQKATKSRLTRKDDLLKLAQLVEVMTHKIDPKLEQHIIQRVKELSNKLFT